MSGFSMRPREKCAAVLIRSLSISMACFARWIARQRSSYRSHGGNWWRLAWLVSWRRSRVREPPIRLSLWPFLNHLQHSPTPRGASVAQPRRRKGTPGSFISGDFRSPMGASYTGNARSISIGCLTTMLPPRGRSDGQTAQEHLPSASEIHRRRRSDHISKDHFLGKNVRRAREPPNVRQYSLEHGWKVGRPSSVTAIIGRSDLKSRGNMA